MDKRELKKEMKAHTGGSFITARQLTIFLGARDQHKVREKYLRGLDRVSGKYYFIPDVVNRLMEET